MSSFAAANLIAKEHQKWVEENMEPDSYLLELNEKWLCYLTRHDQKMFDLALYGSGDSSRIPQSISAISQKAPVFYLNHPEDHGWGYCAIDKGTVAGRLALDYEDEEISDENGLAALSLFGFGEQAIKALSARIEPGSSDMDAMFELCELLAEALSCEIDFTSYDYVKDNEDAYPVIAKK